MQDTPAIRNNTKTEYPQVPLPALITAASLQYARKEAICFEGRIITYEQLEILTNQLAALLVSEGIQKGDRVGYLADRSEYLPVWLIAILKAGAAFVPIDAEFPDNRIAFILEDSGAVILLTQRKYSGRMKGGFQELITEAALHKAQGLSSDVADIAYGIDDLAYILYTSGSTGKPKGVMVPHRGVVNLLWHLHSIGILTEADRLLAITTISFDIAVLELFLPLIAGAHLVITDSRISRDGGALLQLAKRENISVMQATPVTWKIMLAAGWEQALPITILCCGEALPMDLAKKLLPLCQRLFNYYGPTETTIYSTGTQVYTSDKVITIGKPVANTQVYILDEAMNDCAAGDVGELYIGGDGVALGYLNRPELNAWHFVDDARGRLFRTGDIGKWTDEGDIYLYGRADHQVKIRGFRIEPGEIESVLMRAGDVKDAVVTAREDIPGHKMLVAYVIADNATPDIGNWKKLLHKHLPDYMVPHEFVLMNTFPITPNGKTDRKALPKPDKKIAGNHPREHIATGTEQLVTRIWQEILGKENVGVDDDFFDIGGHSLSAVEIMCRLEDATGKMLSIAALFEAPTIRLLSRFIDSGNFSSVWRPLVPVKATGTKPPLYIIHGDGLNVMFFHPVARHLDAEQPVFGLQPKGMNGIDEPDETIEEIAAFYISGIVKDNPNGPYLIAGYSFGGVVAFEMAKQLQRSGREVKMLAMFDTNVGNIRYTGSAVHTVWQKIRLQFPKMGFILNSLGKYPLEVIRYQALVLKRKLKAAIAKLGLSEKPETEQLSPHERKIFEKHQQAYRRYEFTPYRGCIDLFRVKKRLYFVEDPHSLGWEPLVEKRVVIHEVPGDHRTFLLPPNDREFARLLQEVMDRRVNEDC